MRYVYFLSQIILQNNVIHHHFYSKFVIFYIQDLQLQPSELLISSNINNIVYIAKFFNHSQPKSQHG